MKTALVRTGKFRPEALESAETSPDIVVSSLAHFPALLEEDLTADGRREGRRRHHRDRAHRAGARAPGIQGALLHAMPNVSTATRAARPAQSYAGRFAGKEAVGKALGCGVRVHLEGDRDRRAAEARRSPLGANGRLCGAGPGGGDRPLDDALARDCGRHRRRQPARRWLSPPSPSTPRTRCAPRRSGTRATRRRSRSSWTARAGPSRARRCSRSRARDAFACVCGGGSNGGDGRVAARVLRDAGTCRRRDRRRISTRYDVVVDALFGTGFHGAPRPEAAALIGADQRGRRSGRLGRRALGRRRLDGRDRGRRGRRRSHRHLPRAKVGLAVAPGRFHAGRVVVADIGLEGADHAIARATTSILDAVPRRGARDTKYSLRLGPRRRRAAGDGRRSLPHCDGSAARRRRLRDARGAGGVARTCRGARARAREARLDRRRRAVETIAAAAERATALAIGPGLGRSDGAPALVRALLERIDLPAVVDADGLFALEPVARRAATVLTPHAASSRACSDATPPGSTRTGSRPHEKGRERSAPSCSSRAPTPRRGAGRRRRCLRRRDHRRWPRQEPATCSPESWRRFSRKGSMRWPRPPPQQSRTARRRPCGHPQAGLVASDLLTLASVRARALTMRRESCR